MSIKRYTCPSPLYAKDEHTSAATRRVWKARGCKVKPREEGLYMGRKSKDDGVKLFTPSQVELSYALTT